MWFHADAAWGGAAVVSPSLQAFISAGIECADSITCDAHKWLSVPMGCGMFFCRHRESVAQAFRSDVTYMPAKTAASGDDAGTTFDPLTNSAQWSRRFIGLKLFMALAEHGEAGYAAMLEHQARMGRSAARVLWRLRDGASSIPRRCRWCALPAMAWFQAHCWRLFASGRSRGCPKRNSAAFRWCAHASPASEPPSKTLQWVVSEMNVWYRNCQARKTA